MTSSCGTRNIAFSASGAISDPDGDKTLWSWLCEQAMMESIITAEVESGNGKKYLGQFQITTLERSGEFNGAEEWSISLESTGQVDYEESV